MTPDDVSVPGDDAIARAARDGLRHLAGAHVQQPFGWDGVRTRARRVRQQRIAAFVAACAIVVGSAGAAVAATNQDRPHVTIGGRDEPTTTSSTTTTTEPPSTTITTTTIAPPAAGASETTTTGLPASPPQPEDLAGTIAVPAAPLVVGEPATVSVTLRNISDHVISLTPGPTTWIGVWIDDNDNAGLGDVFPLPGTLAPNAERTFPATFSPQAQVVGISDMRVGFLMGHVHFTPTPTAFVDGIPPVTVTVTPPNWQAGQTLDPAMGKWNVVMTADADHVVAGESVELHARITNTGDEPQRTAAYGRLAFTCNGFDGGGYDDTASRVARATLAPGETRVFSFEYAPLSWVTGAIPCELGMAFGTDEQVLPHNGLTSSTVTITVLPDDSTTTTSTSVP